MNRSLLQLLCEPETKAPLELIDEVLNADGTVESGVLMSPSGHRYPIIKGIARFVDQEVAPSVEAFGDEWNHFDFDDFKEHWLHHTVSNTFGDAETFRDQLVIDAGAGSGAQSRWILEAGARHVIALELSHSVDGVLTRNLTGRPADRYDIVQCSIDRPPFKDRSIDGIVICHNVVQHTQSVERTILELWAILGIGELVFNCYRKNDEGLVRWIRHHLIFDPARGILRRTSFRTRLWYSRFVAVARFFPLLGTVLEKSGLMVRGDVLPVPGRIAYIKQQYRAAQLSTFDSFGSHTYQHYVSDSDLRSLVDSLRPSEVLNVERYFKRPNPIGCALRVVRR